MGKVIALVSNALDGIDSGDLCAWVAYQLFAVARLKARCRQVQHLQPRGRHPLHLTVAPSITFSERETDLAKSAQLHSRNVSSMQHSWAATRFLDRVLSLQTRARGLVKKLLFCQGGMCRHNGAKLLSLGRLPCRPGRSILHRMELMTDSIFVGGQTVSLLLPKTRTQIANLSPVTETTLQSATLP